MKHSDLDGDDVENEDCNGEEDGDVDNDADEDENGDDDVDDDENGDSDDEDDNGDHDDNGDDDVDEVVGCSKYLISASLPHRSVVRHDKLMINSNIKASCELFSVWS